MSMPNTNTEEYRYEDAASEFDRMKEIAERHGYSLRSLAPEHIGQWTKLEITDLETGEVIGVVEWDEDTFEANLIDAKGGG